jgi:hypothetical protein
MKHDIQGTVSAVAGSCANCGNQPVRGDRVPDFTGAICCSGACAIISDETLEREIVTCLAEPPTVDCTNCGREMTPLDVVLYSQDGLPFCSRVCERKYPKPIGARELRPVLAGAALAVLALTASLLLCIVYWFKHPH